MVRAGAFVVLVLVKFVLVLTVFESLVRISADSSPVVAVLMVALAVVCLVVVLLVVAAVMVVVLVLVVVLESARASARLRARRVVGAAQSDFCPNPDPPLPVSPHFPPCPDRFHSRCHRYLVG